ncbi:hypothetical protein TNCV_4289721 [Trichonephila clavipes]|nr:hypothetical protein TNCV_4289721 [Trichonephila clavipes]
MAVYLRFAVVAMAWQGEHRAFLGGQYIYNGGSVITTQRAFRIRLQLGRYDPVLDKNTIHWNWARTHDKARHDPIPISLGYRSHAAALGLSNRSKKNPAQRSSHASIQNDASGLLVPVRLGKHNCLAILLWTRSLPRQLTVTLHTQWRIVLKGGKTMTVGRRGSAVGACVGHLLVCEETGGVDDWRIVHQWALMG